MFSYSSSPPKLAASTSPSLIEQLHNEALNAWAAVSKPPANYSTQFNGTTMTRPALQPWPTHAVSVQPPDLIGRPRLQPDANNNDDPDAGTLETTAAEQKQTQPAPDATILSSGSTLATQTTVGVRAPTTAAMSQPNWTLERAPVPSTSSDTSTAFNSTSNTAPASTADVTGPMLADSRFAAWPHSGFVPSQLQSQLAWQYLGQAMQSTAPYRPPVTVAAPSPALPSPFSAGPSAAPVSSSLAPRWASTSQTPANMWAADGHASDAAMYPTLWSWQDPQELRLPSLAAATTTSATVQTLSSPSIASIMPRARHSLDNSPPRDSPLSDGRPELARQVSEHIMLSALNESSKWSRHTSPQSQSMLSKAIDMAQSPAAETPAFDATNVKHSPAAGTTDAAFKQTAADEDAEGEEDARGDLEAERGEDGDATIVKVRKQRRKNGEPPRDLAQRRYACDLCDGEPKLFARPSALRIHKLTHTKEKPHICPDCNRAFAIASNLKRHRRLHLPGGTRETTTLHSPRPDERTSDNNETPSVAAAHAAVSVSGSVVNGSTFELPPAMAMPSQTADILKMAALTPPQTAPPGDPLAQLTATNVFANMAWTTGVVSTSFSHV
ncbi:hypothetical protein ACM66B_002051 [Microbotryomycetes sp. NB124-2]